MREEKKKNYMEEFNKLNEKEVVNDERLEEDEWEKNTISSACLSQDGNFLIVNTFHRFPVNCLLFDD